MTSSYPIARQFSGSLLLITSLVITPESIVAADWTIEPLLEVQEVFTDNVGLAPSGLEQDDFISVITPAVSIGSISKRLDFRLDYSMQNVIYINDSDRNKHVHLVSTNNTAELLKEHLFFDFSLKRSTQNVNNNGNPTADNLNNSSDQGTVLNYELSPYWTQRLGNFANIDLSYSRDQINSSKTFDSSSDDVEINISSGPDFNRFIFDLGFTNKKTQNDSLSSSRTRNISGIFKYLLTRKFAITSKTGYDDNEYESNRNSVDGFQWNAGFEWNPSIRTTVQASYGERYFGSDLKFSLSHRSRRTQTSIQFERTPSTTRETLLQQQAFNLVDLFDNPLDNPADRGIADLDLLIPQQTNEVLIKSKLSLAFKYNMKKNTLSVSAKHEESQFELSGQTEFLQNMNAVWTWNMFPRTSSMASIKWNKNKFRSGRDDTYLIFQYNLSHVITASLTGNIGVRYLDRKSNDALREYDESRIFANLSKKF